MNLTISKEQIINGLQAVQNVVSTRTTLPILSNVLMRAEGDRLQLTATDLDVTVSCAVEAKVKKPGSTTVPVKKLFGIVRELASMDIDLEFDEKNLCSIFCQKTRETYSCLRQQNEYDCGDCSERIIFMGLPEYHQTGKMES